uniref:Uncharacterized protein n=1 Tax=Arundo donax TaxID=35708 RepID=A0A0A9FHV6_ARUDO
MARTPLTRPSAPHIHKQKAKRAKHNNAIPHADRSQSSIDLKTHPTTPHRHSHLSPNSVHQPKEERKNELASQVYTGQDEEDAAEAEAACLDINVSIAQ